MTVVVIQASGKVVLGPTLPRLFRMDAWEAVGESLYRRVWEAMKGSSLSAVSQTAMLSPEEVTSFVFRVASTRSSMG